MRDLISDFNSMKAIPNSIPKNAIPIQMMAISNSIPIPPGLGKANSNSGIGLGISKQIQFRSGIDPDSGALFNSRVSVVFTFNVSSKEHLIHR